MMDIVLFSSITTESALTKLEAEGKKYTGLWCDMDDKEQRGYVKSQAVLINKIIKQVDRSRIDQKKAFGLNVEAEAKAITERLQAANLPFTMLIDAHKHERAEILAAQKARDDAMALALQIETDHENAIMWDKVEMFEKAEREKVRLSNEKRIGDEAASKAVEQEQRRQANEAKRLEVERLQREADKAHVSNVRRKAKECLMAYGIDEDMAKTIVIAIHKGGIANVKISY